MKKLLVAVISKSDASGGGAGRSAETLTRLLIQNGHVAHHWLGYPSKRWLPSMRKLHGEFFGQMFYRSCLYLSRRIGLPDFITPEIFFHIYRKEVDYDIYHFNDITITFSPIALRWLAKHTRVVWTFRDCSPFTGGCIYPLECTAYMNDCGNCPQLGQWPLLTSIDRTGFVRRFKRTTARQNLFIPVVPSNWMAEQAMSSGFFEEKPAVIYNSVNINLFRPLDKVTIRQILQLPVDQFIVLIGSMELNNKFKGLNYALEALRHIDPPPYILAIGSPPKNISDEFKGLNIHFTGYIQDDILLAQYYSAADIFLFPTLADNCPNSVLETMATATPTIAFSVGGLPELIDHNSTGLLVRPKNVSELVAALRFAIDNVEKRISWGKAARLKVENSFNENILITKYLKLYHSLVDE
ncbi:MULTISPECIES: glycosyltransferase [Methylomonas]|uniref:glycosyltransferase n=1 Tax=Methylomonas TaxID=416 RepID=UPI001231BE3B|nr:glycosyltransferase [Methylomonas rhizoryzae]